VAVATVLFGCGAEVDDLDAVKLSTRKKPSIVAPKLGAVLGSPWTPILARLPEGYERARVMAKIDGRPVDLPSPAIRRRMDKRGGGLDYIAAFDLEGMAHGQHAIELDFHLPDGTTSSTRRAFTYKPEEARVELTVSDGQHPVSARILVLDAKGKHVNTYPKDAREADKGGRDRRLGSHFAVGGRAAFHLKPGTYTLVAVRSFLDHIDAQEVQLSPGTTRLAFEIPPAVSAPGWISADTDVHSARSTTPSFPTCCACAASRPPGWTSW